MAGAARAGRSPDAVGLGRAGAAGGGSRGSDGFGWGAIIERCRAASRAPVHGRAAGAWRADMVFSTTAIGLGLRAGWDGAGWGRPRARSVGCGGGMGREQWRPRPCPPVGRDGGSRCRSACAVGARCGGLGRAGGAAGPELAAGRGAGSPAGRRPQHRGRYPGTVGGQGGDGADDVARHRADRAPASRDGASRGSTRPAAHRTLRLWRSYNARAGHRSRPPTPLGPRAGA